MKRFLALLLAASFAGVGNAHAEGFGTPTMDGLLAGDEAAYGAPEASDPVDPPQGNANMDLGDLYVCNDLGFWYFLFTINDNVATTNWGKYGLSIDTTNDTAGATSDAWGRNIEVSDPHKVEYTVRTWVDGGGAYGAGKTQFWAWDGAAWNQDGTADDAVLNAAAVSGIEWKIARSRIGDPSTMWVEIISTRGNDNDNAQDTINDPADDWNATDWATTAVVLNSTEVNVSSGSDTVPPTVVDGCSPDLGDGFSDTVVLTFSEPVDTTTALNTANYADLGGRSIFSPTLTTPTTVEFLVSPIYGFGGCNQIRATGVEDLAGNTIVDNGDTNVANFYGFQLNVRGHMSLRMQSNDTPPHTFAIEGSVPPLTWNPTCDDLLEDADADSVYTTDLTFCLPCSSGTGGPEVTPLEYKFTHQCTDWESVNNHTYTIDAGAIPTGLDTVDIWWNDQAPSDFTTVDIKVVATVVRNPAFATTDLVGVNGSQLPFTWDVPPVNLMHDDGVDPDVAADDGTYSGSFIFPAGSAKNMEYKYLLKAAADTAFAYECQDQSNRTLFLDDTQYSIANPLVVDLAAFDICRTVMVGVDDLLSEATRILEPTRPNPFIDATTIAFSVRERAAVRLDIYDVDGRLVRTLVDEVRGVGRHTVTWNGRRADGTALASGVYFSRIKVGQETDARKIVIIH